MTLKSFGCSFIYGSDLPVPQNAQEPYAEASQLTWPALLAKHLNKEYQCYARPGSGNTRILEKILTQANNFTSNDLFVIGWTWIDRFDYTVSPTGQDHVYDLAGNNLWQTIMPTNHTEITQIYYRDLHSEFRDKLTNLINIKMAIDTLKQKQIPFIMTFMDELMFDVQWHATPVIIELQEYIRPYMTQFENQTFLNWSKQKGFPISKTLHPLEVAHQVAFELIKSYNLV
jgi:hypothetical protein